MVAIDGSVRRTSSRSRGTGRLAGNGAMLDRANDRIAGKRARLAANSPRYRARYNCGQRVLMITAYLREAHGMETASAPSAPSGWQEPSGSLGALSLHFKSKTGGGPVDNKLPGLRQTAASRQHHKRPLFLV
jgi:hypothetical protein